MKSISILVLAAMAFFIVSGMLTPEQSAVNAENAAATVATASASVGALLVFVLCIFVLVISMLTGRGGER